MKSELWRYKIVTGKTPVILSLIMLAIFGGISIWLYSTKNGAFLFGAMLTAIMAVVLFFTIYRYFFYKVLIGRDGFYYQTQINNGSFYPYSLIRKAWISSGKDLSGHKQKFCNIETPNREVIRFQFFYQDRKAVQYLVKRTEAAAAARTDMVDAAGHEYRIDGKQHGRASIVVVVVLVVIELVLSISLMNSGKHFIFPGILGIVMLLFILAMVVMRYFCYQIQICEQGFYYQTTPFNGTFFKYADITGCREVVRVYHHRGSADRLHYFYFVFTDKSGKTRKFLFNKPMYELEVNVLKERIESQY